MARRKNISKQTRLLLSILVEAPAEVGHGYELCKKTGLKSGTLYPILIRLEEQGYLSSDWQTPSQPGKPPRRAYRLTPEGVAFAQAHSMEQKNRALMANPKGAPA